MKGILLTGSGHSIENIGICITILKFNEIFQKRQNIEEK